MGSSCTNSHSTLPWHREHDGKISRYTNLVGTLTLKHDLHAGGAGAAAGYFALLFQPNRAARAAVITVTSIAGTLGGPDCTLRDAITAANGDVAAGGCPAGSGADTILLATGATYTLTEVDNTVEQSGTPLPNGLPSVTSEITINGNPAIIARSSADSTPAFRLLHVAQGGRLTINGLTLTNDKMPDIPATQAGSEGHGGGIFNEGVLTLINATVTANNAGNTAVISHQDISPAAGCAGRGGGIFNTGTLTLIATMVSLNHAGTTPTPEFGGTCPGDGGGIYNDVAAILTLDGTTVSGNVAGHADSDSSHGGNGGGVFNSGALTVTRSTVNGNSTGGGTGGGNGGGIANGGSFSSPTGGTVTLVNSTVSGNRAGDSEAAPGNGGGIFNAATLMLLSNIVAANVGAVDQGCVGGVAGISNAGGLVVVRNSLIAENVTPLSGGHCGGTATSSDCGGTLTSQGYNLIQDSSHCTTAGDAIGDMVGVDPHLGPLQDNGGPTQTQALLTGSPAIDAGNPDGCVDLNGDALTTDQRGASRVVGGDARCDIGAYEAGVASRSGATAPAAGGGCSTGPLPQTPWGTTPVLLALPAALLARNRRQVLGRACSSYLEPMLHRHKVKSDPARSVWTSTALTCAVLLVASVHSAQAGINVWTSHGPEGVSVSALAIDPSTPTTLYAGTDNGVFKIEQATTTPKAASSGCTLTLGEGASSGLFLALNLAAVVLLARASPQRSTFRSVGTPARTRALKP
jgi:hypothetical protein